MLPSPNELDELQEKLLHEQLIPDFQLNKCGQEHTIAYHKQEKLHTQTAK
jgi:hypothetical protein